MRTRFKAFITQYALTSGVFEAEVEDCFDISDRMVKTVGGGIGCVHMPHWHRTKAEAVAHAEKMRTAKIASMKRSMAKIEALDFAADLSR